MRFVVYLKLVCAYRDGHLEMHLPECYASQPAV